MKDDGDEDPDRKLYDEFEDDEEEVEDDFGGEKSNESSCEDEEESPSSEFGGVWSFRIDEESKGLVNIWWA